MSEAMAVEDAIIALLKKEKKPLSTYQIAKKIGISWSTANTYCYKMKDKGLIKGKEQVAKVGMNKKMVWWV
ncbi:MAG: winged helix-turn-helix transcriptional regulator [Candidatus Nanohaloarchaeota archaeon]|nr:winged helix-turn-helix transcriptional regulator [Candidatus Nanohaloarchaeota archaeon]